MHKEGYDQNYSNQQTDLNVKLKVLPAIFIILWNKIFYILIVPNNYYSIWQEMVWDENTYKSQFFCFFFF